MPFPSTDQSAHSSDWAQSTSGNGCENQQGTLAADTALRPAVHAFLDHLLKLQLLSASFSERFLRQSGAQISDIETEEQLGALVRRVTDRIPARQRRSAPRIGWFSATTSAQPARSDR